MPSSHSQFLGFFCSFFLAHFYLHHPRLARPRTLVNTMRRIEHWFAMAAIVGLTAATCYSRWHLSYHSSAQVLIGLGVGLLVGSGYYYLTEYLPRQPIRLPAPLGSPVSSPTSKPRKAAPLAGGRDAQASGVDGVAMARQRSNKASSPTPHSPPPASGHKRRRSSLAASLMPELHPSPPLRQIILDHPLAVAFRLRDSWTVWLDGGIEGEYEAWRTEWERRRRPVGSASSSASSSRDASLARPPASSSALAFITGSSSNGGASLSPKSTSAATSSTTSSEPHLSHILTTLRLASLCPPTKTAFCVGCVIATRDSTRIFTTGYSRETGEQLNEHAEQVALGKLGTVEYQLASGKVEGEGRVAELDLYTSMEPCSERLSGALPCVQRILAFNDDQQRRRTPSRLTFRITRVFQALREPEDFIAENVSAGLLREAGVELMTVVPPPKSGGGYDDGRWIEREALRLAKNGHPDQPTEREGESSGWREARLP